MGHLLKWPAKKVLNILRPLLWHFKQTAQHRKSHSPLKCQVTILLFSPMYKITKGTTLRSDNSPKSIDKSTSGTIIILTHLYVYVLNWAVGIILVYFNSISGVTWRLDAMQSEVGTNISF